MRISNVDIYFMAGQIDADEYAFVPTGENVTGQALVSLSHSQPNYANVETLSCELATVPVIIDLKGRTEPRVGYRIHIRFNPTPTDDGYIQVKLLEEVFEVSAFPRISKFSAWVPKEERNNTKIRLQALTTTKHQYRQYTEFLLNPFRFNRDGISGDVAVAPPGSLFFFGDEPDRWGIAAQDYARVYEDWVDVVKQVDPTAKVSPAGGDLV